MHMHDRYCGLLERAELGLEEVRVGAFEMVDHLALLVEVECGVAVYSVLVSQVMILVTIHLHMYDT